MTVTRAGKPDIHVDNVQKLFPLTRTTAIGFVGDIEVAGLLLKGLLIQLQRKVHEKKADPVSLHSWIPRYLSTTYAKISQKFGARPVDFVVASVLLGRPNVIEREKVRAIMERFRLGQLSAQRNWLPGILVNILSTPPTTEYIALDDVPFGLLYFMKCPTFNPIHLKPLEFGAIGSGKDVELHIDRNLDWIFAGNVGNHFMEAMALRETVVSFIQEHNIESVGGLYPCLKIGSQGLMYLGYMSQIPTGGTKIELSVDDNRRWIQKNLTTGKEIKLLYPWEIIAREYSQDRKFNDYLGAFTEYKVPSEIVISVLPRMKRYPIKIPQSI
jgi:hypothetical protein